MEHRTEDELTAALPDLRAAPADAGRLEMIVRRPAVDEREVLDTGELDLAVGLVGDTWVERGSSRTEDGSSHHDMQLNVMSARMVDLIAGARDRWPLAGDQLYVDLDLSAANLPPGTLLHRHAKAVRPIHGDAEGAAHLELGVLECGRQAFESLGQARLVGEGTGVGFDVEGARGPLRRAAGGALRSRTARGEEHDQENRSGEPRHRG